MTTERDDRHAMFEFAFQCQEQSFIRHLLYCWLFRHNPLAANPYGESVRMAILMLRMKRAVAKLTDTELAVYGIDPSTRDKHEGWTTNLGPVDMEILDMKLDPKRRKRRTCPQCLKSIGYCDQHQNLRWKREEHG